MTRPASLDLDTMLKRLHLPTIGRPHAELVVRADQHGTSYRDQLGTCVRPLVAAFDVAAGSLAFGCRVCYSLPEFASIEE